MVGVGPGDPELMTYKAIKVLEASPVWIAPKAQKNGSSSALHIAAGLVAMDGKEILELHFPMKKVRLNHNADPELVSSWKNAAQKVINHLESGIDVAFPTLGDPALYSTAFYLLAALQEQCTSLKVTIVPGITAMAACSAKIGNPLGLGDDVVTIVPAAFDDERLRDIISTFDAVVLMKVYKKMARVVELLDEMNLTDKAVLIERCGLPDQKIYTDVRTAVGKELHYFSTLLIRKKEVVL